MDTKPASNGSTDSKTAAKRGPAATALKWAQLPFAFGFLVGLSAVMKGNATLLGKILGGTIIGGIIGLLFGGIAFGIGYVVASVASRRKSQGE